MANLNIDAIDDLRNDELETQGHVLHILGLRRAPECKHNCLLKGFLSTYSVTKAGVAPSDPKRPAGHPSTDETVFDLEVAPSESVARLPKPLACHGVPCCGTDATGQPQSETREGAIAHPLMRKEDAAQTLEAARTGGGQEAAASDGTASGQEAATRPQAWVKGRGGAEPLW